MKYIDLIFHNYIPFKIYPDSILDSISFYFYIFIKKNKFNLNNNIKLKLKINNIYDITDFSYYNVNN